MRVSKNSLFLQAPPRPLLTQRDERECQTVRYYGSGIRAGNDDGLFGVPELCLLQGVCRRGASLQSWLPASDLTQRSEVFLVRDIAGEDREYRRVISLGPRTLRSDVSGSEGRGYGCWPALCLCGKIIIEAAEHGEFGDLLVSQFQRRSA